MKSATRTPRKPTIPSSRRTRRVLVAEADAEIRRELADALEAEGRDVLTAADGLTAIQLSTEPGIEMLIVDLLLPQASGLRVAEAFRRARGRDVAILLTSTLDSEELRSLAFAEGVDRFLVKPIHPRELIPEHASLKETIPEFSLEPESRPSGSRHA